MKKSASEALYERYGTSISPGSKGGCPSCHHEHTLSVKGDDSVAKCFHPGCNFKLIPSVDDTGIGGALQKIMTDVAEDFHQEILAMRDRKGVNAYTYLLDHRKIHPTVIAQSSLGAVPQNYDISSKFELPLQKMRDQLKKMEQTLTGRGKKEKIEGQKQLIALFEDYRNQLNELIYPPKNEDGKERAPRFGLLVFPYYNRSHQVVSMRFRLPYTKYFVSFMPFQKSRGLFGTEFLISRLKPDTELTVVEGEINALQLQTVRLYEAEGRGAPVEYWPVVAVGGVLNADHVAIKQLCTTPAICYDNDADKAGNVLLENARKHSNVYAFTTPKVDSDLDEFLTDFGRDYVGANEAFLKIYATRQLQMRSYEGLASEIFFTRLEPRKAFDINANVWEVVIDDLRVRGHFFNDKTRAYYFLREEKKLIEITPENKELFFFLDRYGLIKTETVASYVTEKLFTEAFTRGTQTKVHRMSFYDPDKNVLYFSNFKNQIYVITADGITLEDNGIDGVLFINDPSWEPFELLPYNPQRSLFDELIIQKINFDEDVLSPNERRILFSVWCVSIPFQSIMPTKAILAFIGPKGSGKSITNRKFGKMLFGDCFNATPLAQDPKDFDAALTNSSLLAIDNADEAPAWLNDRLAVAATGGTVKRREYYTTNSLIDIPVNCNLAITSRTPEFRRDDVADRLLIFKVKRFGRFSSENVLLAEIVKNRAQLLSEYIYLLQEAVRALGARAGIVEEGEFRMADFSDFAMKMAHGAGLPEKMQSILEKLSCEQSIFTLEGEPVFDLLCLWAKKNSDKEVTNQQLLKELYDLSLAREIDLGFAPSDHRSFTQKMIALRPNLERFLDTQERGSGSRAKKYRFSIKKGAGTK